jgi:hypothetical protein
VNRLTSLSESTERLRRELRAVHDALSVLTTRLDTVRVQTEQLAALRQGERDAAARMDELEHILDFERVGAHVREAVQRAELVEAPVPYAIIDGLLPPAVYEAAINAIPSRIFFDDRGGYHELPVPPALAPIHSVATWTFMVSVMNDVLAPALLERFEEPLDRHLTTLCPSVERSRNAGIVLTVSRSRMVLRRPGDASRTDRGGPWDWLTVVLYLARTNDGEDYGSRVRGSDAFHTIPFRPNSALTFFHATAAHEYVSIPATAPHGTERYACEFRIGPDKATRRMLGNHPPS